MASCIQHPEKTPMVLLRREYLDITGNHCAAKLLAVFEFWTNKLRSAGDALGKTARDWIYKSLETLQNELMDEHGIPAIRFAIDILIDLGFISRRHNPHIPYDRTWQYKLEVEKVQEALDLLNSPLEQIEDVEQPNPTPQTEPSNTPKATNNNIESNIVTPKKKTQKPVFEKKEAEPEVIQRIADYCKCSLEKAAYTLSMWRSEWNNKPSIRDWMQETFSKLGLDLAVLTL